MNPKTENALDFKFTDALLLALIPALAYLFIFCFERGYAWHFGIPSYLINLGLTNILNDTITFLGWLLIFYISINFLFRLVSSKANLALVRRVLLLAGIVISFSVQLWSVGITNISLWIGLALVMIFYFVYELIVPVFSQKATQGYWAKLNAQDEQDDAKDKILYLLNRLFGIGPIIIIFVLLVGVPVSIALGKIDAASQINYLVTNTSPEQIVLRNYGDYLITARFERAERIVYKEFALIKIGDDASMRLHEEQLGILVPTNLLTTTVNP